MGEIKTIPFAILPLPVMKKYSRRFVGIGVKLGKLFPNLGLYLEQANIDATEREYLSIMTMLTVVYGVFFLVVSALVFYRVFGFANITQNALLSVGVSIVLAFLFFIQISTYPLIVTKRKIRDIERNLSFALRTLLVQIKSGVSLFDGLNMLASKRYGALSEEFKKALDEINTGTSEQIALEKLAIKNPSPFFRKSLWQIVNGMRAGADISDILKETVSSITKTQIIEVNKYGAKLRLMSLFYMMIGVIIPSLGITFLMILASFPSIVVNETVFWIMLAGIIIFEFMYLGLIKSQRPNLLSV